jgi:nicotinamidase-related amidase
MKPWDKLIPQSELDIYRDAGFGGALALGKRPALLIIDVQYRTVGSKRVPIQESMKEFKTSCGEIAWAAVDQIGLLLELFRQRSWPVIYPYVAPKIASDYARISEKSPGLMSASARGYDFVEEVAPLETELMLPKRHPSAFFGTPLTSYLVDLGVDTLIVTGCATSGCVRGTVVDGFSYNFRVAVPHDAVFDRSQVSHAVNLFDMASKYAEVDTTAAMLERLARIGRG